jgi:hypothetical protein
MLIYYVYAYLRGRSSSTASAGTPYYIGKGTKNRAWSTSRGTPKPKNPDNIVILENNLTNLGALAIERRMIRWYGRKDIGTGILLNHTDGGDGFPGGIFSEEHRSNLSKSRTGRKHSEETKNKVAKFRTGRKHSEETKIKIGESRKARWEEAKIFKNLNPTSLPWQKL